MPLMVDIHGLSKSFGPIRAVDNVSFQVREGEVLGFLGPNGAGKSTTMKMIAGFLVPDAGRVELDGEDLARNPISVKRKIGYLPEGAPLYADMTPARFLDFIAEVRGLRGKDKHARIRDVIDKVHLDNVLEQPIDTLSKGFKRRVGLAQAILHDPPVLLLDEPTDGLDPNQKHEVRTLIRTMSAKKVIILSTHILEEVDAVCTRAIIIAGGRILVDGTPAQLEQNAPGHNAVTLSVLGGEPQEITEALSGLEGVAKVELVGEALAGEAAGLSVRVFPVDGGSIAASVSQLAQVNTWQVTELHVEHGRLEEVFRQVTTGQGRDSNV